MQYKLLLWRIRKKVLVISNFPLDNVNFGFFFTIDQHIRLYDTTNGNFKLFRDITAKDVGWSIVDTAYSPDQNYIIYSSWSEYSTIYFEFQYSKLSNKNCDIAYYLFWSRERWKPYVLLCSYKMSHETSHYSLLEQIMCLEEYQYF